MLKEILTEKLGKRWCHLMTVGKTCVWEWGGRCGKEQRSFYFSQVACEVFIGHQVDRSGRKLSLLGVSSKVRGRGRQYNLGLFSAQGVLEALDWMEHQGIECRRRNKREGGGPPLQPAPSGGLEAKEELQEGLEGTIHEASRWATRGTRKAFPEET